jgi:hypothetical protein
MDEMGHQEWADHQREVCYGSNAHDESQVYFSVTRTGKRITLIGCDGADVSFLKPLIVLLRKTYDSDLALLGRTDEKVGVYSQSKGYTGRPIFLSWLCDLFIPELNRRRTAFGYAGRAVLIMDNCTTHTWPEVEGTCTEAGVLVCLYHHTAQIRYIPWIYQRSGSGNVPSCA